MMVGEFAEDVMVLIERSKDIETFILKKKEDIHKKEKDLDNYPNRSMSIAQRI